jgi:hypothetical protein
MNKYLENATSNNETMLKEKITHKLHSSFMDELNEMNNTR